MSSPRLLADRKREVPSDFNIVAGTYDTLVQRNPGYMEHLQLSAQRLELPDGGRGLRGLRYQGDDATVHDGSQKR